MRAPVFPSIDDIYCTFGGILATIMSHCLSHSDHFSNGPSLKSKKTQRIKTMDSPLSILPSWKPTYDWFTFVSSDGNLPCHHTAETEMKPKTRSKQIKVAVPCRFSASRSIGKSRNNYWDAEPINQYKRTMASVFFFSNTTEFSQSRFARKS